MTGRLGQMMQSAQPEVLRAEPTPRYWDLRRAWDREVREAIESAGVAAPLIVETAGVLLLDLDASAFVIATQFGGNATLSSGGWLGGTATTLLWAPIGLPVGQTLSRLVFNVKGDATVVMTVGLRARDPAGVLSSYLVSQDSALTATDQRITVTLPSAVRIGQYSLGTFLLQCTLTGTGAAASTLALRSVQIYS